MNVVTDFLMQTIKRFLSANPSYFKVINIILTVVAVVTGLPGFLAQIGIELPSSLSFFASKTIAIAAIVGRFLTQLTTTDKAILAKQKS